MKKEIFSGFLVFLTALPILAQETPLPTATAPLSALSTTPVPAASVALKKWNVSSVPWKDWFKKNAVVEDKGDHIHFLWDAQDFKANFEVKDKKKRLAQAAVQLVKLLYPADAKVDQVTVDIVYVPKKDAYGEPIWNSLQKVAHLEFLKSKALKAGSGNSSFSEPAMKRLFEKFEVFNNL